MIYVIRTKTRREFSVVNALREAGFAAYVPAETLRRRLGRILRPIQRPVCPGYAFVACAPDDIARIGRMDDVVDFLRPAPGAMPSRVPANDIAPILLAEIFGALDHTKEPKAYTPAKGDRVRVIAGMFKDYIGKVIWASKVEASIEPDRGGRVTLKLNELEIAA